MNRRDFFARLGLTAGALALVNELPAAPAGAVILRDAQAGTVVRWNPVYAPVHIKVSGEILAASRNSQGQFARAMRDEQSRALEQIARELDRKFGL